MVRALHERLHVPAKALIQQAELLEPVKEAPDWNCFPVRHMISRGWIDEFFGAVQRFFSQIPSGVKADLLWRKSQHIRSARKMDIYALKAWTARILIEELTEASRIQKEFGHSGIHDQSSAIKFTCRRTKSGTGFFICSRHSANN